MKQHQNQVITQNAYVVRDIEEAVDRWRQFLNIGPVFVMPHIPLDSVTYRGTPAELDLTAAVAFAGHVQLEWIVQHNDAPSAYRDVVPAGEEGFHHICFYPDDYDAEVARYEALGCPIATSGAVSQANGRRFCYIDTRPQLNCMVELVDAPEGAGVVWEALREATDTWDGKTDPIREVALGSP